MTVTGLRFIRDVATSSSRAKPIAALSHRFIGRTSLWSMRVVTPSARVAARSLRFAMPNIEQRSLP